jgi:hypothetical protein
VWTRRFLALIAYIIKTERPQIKNPLMHLKLLEKQELNPKQAHGKK